METLSALLALCEGIHWSHLDFPHKGPVVWSKVHGANMGPIWGRQDPGGHHVGPMNFAIWVVLLVWTASWTSSWDTYDLRPYETRWSSCDVIEIIYVLLYWPSLVQIVAQCQLSTKPLPELMLNYFQWSIRNKYEIKIWQPFCNN